MRLPELAKLPDHTPRSTGAERRCLHQLSVDDAVCELLRTRPGIAEDPPSLLSAGRSADETINHVRHAGRYEPPTGSCNHGAVRLVTGVGELPCERWAVRATVLCAPEELVLFAIVHKDTYHAMLANAHVRSRSQSMLFSDKRRAELYYASVQTHYEKTAIAPECAPPFWVSIRNGLAFLRVDAAETACIEGIRCPFQLQNTGLFRYYDGKPVPGLRFVLQVESATEYTSRWTWPATHNRQLASLDALLAFFGTNGPSATTDNRRSWAGASEEAESATAAETAAVVATHVAGTAMHGVAVQTQPLLVATAVSKSADVLRRLKRALERT